MSGGVPFIDLIDQFLAGGEWDEGHRASLLAEREEAEQAYNSNDMRLAIALTKGLHRECSRLGMVEAVRPHVVRDRKRQAGAKLGAAASAAARAILPDAESLQSELQSKIDIGDSPAEAKLRLRRKYGVSPQAIGQKLKKAKAA